MIYALLTFVVPLVQASIVAEDRSQFVPYAETIAVDFPATPNRAEELGPHATTRVVRVKRGDQALDEVRVVLAPTGTDPSGEARFTTAALKSREPFRDLLISWNVDSPPRTAFIVEVRVAADQQDWSPWMLIGDWGIVLSAPQVVTCAGGRIDTDYFRGDHPFARAQIRLRGFAPADLAERELVLRRLTVCFSDPTLLVDPSKSAGAGPPVPSAKAPDSWKRMIDVPFRSQRAEDPEISSRICSPTSLSMVLAYRGVTASTADVVARTFDVAHDIYGNWPRNIQAAYSFGVPGYLTRFTHWASVEAEIARGQPIIASIGVKKGELSGAPYQETTGHLIVLLGFDSNGDVYVNDPAADEPKAGKRVYARAELQTVWIERGGTAYVLLEKP